MPQANPFAAQGTVKDLFAGKPIASVWKDLKTRIAKDARSEKDADVKQDLLDLLKSFDQGLGPSIKKWEAELKSFPNHDLKKVGKLGVGIARILKDYEKKVNGSEVGPGPRNTFVTALGAVAAEMLKQQKFYTTGKA